MNLTQKTLVITLFMLATLAWAAAQQPGSTPGPSSGQATSPSSQMPDASQSQPSTPGSAGQTPQGSAQPGSQGQAASAPVTEGCLGGHDPNYTITDKAGTTYKLNLPPNADTSKLSQHVGESVDVAGNVKGSGNTSAIEVQGIGRGSGKCPGSGSTGAQSPPKQ